MPTAEQIRQYLTVSVIPVLAGIVADWLTVHLHFLATFHIGKDSVAQAVAQVLIFGVTAALAALAAHHVLRGHYTPDAKADTSV